MCVCVIKDEMKGVWSERKLRDRKGMWSDIQGEKKGMWSDQKGTWTGEKGLESTGMGMWRECVLKGRESLGSGKK